MNQRMRTIALALVVIAIAATGCAPASAPQSEIVERTVVVELVAAMAPRAPAPEPAFKESALGSAADDLPNASDRMIIQTIDMSIVVEDTDETLELVTELVQGHRGYVSDLQRWLANDQPYANVTLRIPAESLEEVRGQLRSAAIKVQSENASGQDVTEEFVDIQARVRNLEATEVELLALLTEVRENRGKADEILAIHRELTNIRGQIESLKGRSQFLERMTALATIHLEIRPKAAPRPVVDRPQWDPAITTNRALRGFVQLLELALDVLIYLLIFSPFVLIPGVVIWLLVRAAKKRKQRRKDEGTNKNA